MGPRDLNNSLATDQVAINPMDNHDYMTDLFPSSASWVQTSPCTPVTPVVSYMLIGFAGCSVNREISHAHIQRKLANGSGNYKWLGINYERKPWWGLGIIANGGRRQSEIFQSPNDGLKAKMPPPIFSTAHMARTIHFQIFMPEPGGINTAMLR
ncbi:hypothetical protein NC652_005358 [Populus alba x Populus x berolinensis]|nr:hypothetical protein NC652_005358 [Populus alba x Populus x berolinensis]